MFFTVIVYFYISTLLDEIKILLLLQVISTTTLIITLYTLAEKMFLAIYLSQIIKRVL